MEGIFFFLGSAVAGYAGYVDLPIYFIFVGAGIMALGFCIFRAAFLKQLYLDGESIRIGVLFAKKTLYMMLFTTVIFFSGRQAQEFVHKEILVSGEFTQTLYWVSSHVEESITGSKVKGENSRDWRLLVDFSRDLMAAETVSESGAKFSIFTGKGINCHLSGYIKFPSENSEDLKSRAFHYFATDGEEMGFAMQVDSRDTRIWDGAMMETMPELVSYTFSLSQAGGFVEDIKSGKRLRAAIEGHDLAEFSLKGSSKAINSIVEACAKAAPVETF